jgi:aryl-alcohol dehydrogenase-like predicted oxidoreductase
MSHPAVTAPIVGADTVEQLDGSLAALDIDMTLDLREAVTALSIPPDESIEREVD